MVAILSGGRSRSRSLLLAGLLAVALSAAACGPEADRERGGGDGADPGNRGELVELHGDDSPVDRIYYKTPREAAGTE